MIEVIIKYLVKSKICFTIILFTTFCACQNKEQTKKYNGSDSIIVYNEDDYYKIINGMIKVVDTACTNEEQKANLDIEDGKIVYFFFNGRNNRYRSNNEMKILLSKYDIKVDSVLSYCAPPMEGFRRNCYISIMHNEIQKRHGKSFIDSIRISAEKKFILNHPNIVYRFEECDTISRYPNGRNMKHFFSEINIDFFKNFKYPKGYRTKNEKYSSYTSANFVLLKNGSISNLKIEEHFQNPENEKYAIEFRNAVKYFIESTKWIPATKMDIAVNSEMSQIFIHH